MVTISRITGILTGLLTKKILLTISAIALFALAWTYSYVGRIHHEPLAKGERPAMVALDFADVQNFKNLRFDPRCEGDFLVTRCLFQDIGIQVQSRFEGFCWQKPFYRFFSLFGGRPGWGRYRTCYGRRMIKVINTRKYSTQVFAQYFWNSADYSEIAAHLLLDLADGSLVLVADKFGANLSPGGMTLDAYVLPR